MFSAFALCLKGGLDFLADVLTFDSLRFIELEILFRLAMKGMEQNDYYVVFEYGMKDGKKQMHNQDAGISPMDRREVFEDITCKLTAYTSGSRAAVHEAGNDTITQTFFEDDFSLKTKENLHIKFKEMVNAICGKNKMIIEVCYSSGQEVLKDALIQKLNEHFTDTKVEISSISMGTLTECLPYSDERKKGNLEGYNKRICEIKDKMGMVKEPTISIVIIHAPEYYKLSGRADCIVDPKNALRVGFADTGRLTQFVTIEKYIEKENERLKKIESGKVLKKNGEVNKTNAVNNSIKSTLLDVYRQLGIHNCLVESEKKTTLQNKIAVGIYVFNSKTLANDVTIAQFPLIVSCDLANDRIMVQTEFCVVSKFTHHKESIEHIVCEYKEFPIKLREILARIGSGKRIIPSDRFLCDWFEDLKVHKQYEVMIVADRTSRKVVEGITNKEIREVYDAQSGNVSSVVINGKKGFVMNLENCPHIDFIRLRINDEVPDYIPCPNDEQKTFGESSGVYRFDSIYYSKDSRTQAEYKNTKQNTTKLEDDKAFTHRNIIEIYPMYIRDKARERDCIRDVHNLRNASIQYEAGKTILPLPLHLAKLLEQYFI